MGRDEFEGLRAIAVVTGIEHRFVQRDGRIVAQDVVAAIRAVDDHVAAGKRPSRDLAISRLVPLREVESAHAGPDDCARTGVGDDVARQGKARNGGVTDLVTDAQGGGGLREIGRAGDGHTEHLLGVAATGEGDPGGVDREVVDDRGSVSGRTVDDRRHIRRAEVIEGGHGEVVTLACTELLGVEAGHDFDGDRVAEGKDTPRERDGASAETQRVVDDESAADGAVRKTRLDLTTEIGGLDVASIDGRATGVGVSAHFVADGKRRGNRGRAEARLHEGDGAQAIADDAGEDLAGLKVTGVEGERARRGVVVRDEARARQATEGETEAVEVQGPIVVDLEVDAGVRRAAARGDGASPGEAQRAFLNKERAEDRGARDRHRHHVGGTAEDEIARARLDEVSRDEIRVDGRGRAGLPFPDEDIGVRRGEGQGRGRAAEAERAAARDGRSGRAGAVHDEAAADETEGVRGVVQREIAAELEAILFDQAGDRGGRRGLAEIRLTRDTRAGRGGGVGVEVRTRFGDGGELGATDQGADAGAGRDARTGDQHARDEARIAGDGDRVARQHRGETVQGDRRREAVARLAGDGRRGEGTDRQCTRADGRNRRTSRDTRTSDDHASGKTCDVGEVDDIGADGRTHGRQLDLGRVGGTDTGGAGGRGDRAQDKRGTVAVDGINRGAGRDARADKDHARGKSSGAEKRDVGGGTVRDEAADRLRQRNIGNRCGGETIGGGVVRKGGVATRRSGADDDARGIDDAARTGGRDSRAGGGRELLGDGTLTEVGEVATHDRQRALGGSGLGKSVGRQRVHERTRRSGDREIAAAAVIDGARGAKHHRLAGTSAVRQAEEAAVNDEGTIHADERIAAEIGRRDRVEAVIDGRAGRDPRIVTADRQAGVRRDARKELSREGRTGLDRIHHESAEASLGEIEGTCKAFGRDGTASSREGLVEAAEIEGITLGDVQEAGRREDVLVVRGEGTVDRERATVEVDEGRTRQEPTGNRRPAEHAAGARGGIEREAERSVLGNDEAARVDLPGGAE